MTASPIDAKSDVVQAASELESLLHSRIATTDDMSLSSDPVKKPSEHILWYNTLPQPFETKLLQAVKAQYGHIAVFDRTLGACPEISRDLGSWCANQYLIDALCEKRLRRYEVKTERAFYARSATGDVTELDKKQAELRSAIDFAEKERKRPAAVEQHELSSKVTE